MVLGALCTGGAGSAGCVDHRDGITGTQSIQVELVSPVDPGAVDRPLSPDQRMVEIDLTARDAAGNIDTSFEREVQVYAQFLGTLTPALGADPPLAKIQMIAGQAMGTTIMLPPVFGPTTLWIDDGQDAEPTYATGTSPALWYRAPFIADIQTPGSQTASDALTRSPLELKQVTVNGSRHGALGRLVVTSTYSQGYTVSDVKCMDATGAPPCTADAYDHIVVFTFSAPADQQGRALRVGQTIDAFSGGISEFNGLTEIGFPGTQASSDEVALGRLPAPAVFDSAWFGPLSDPGGRINFERNEAAAIEVDGGTVCELDDEYETFRQWKLDPAGVGGDCSNNSNVLNVITTGVIADFDPAALVGKTLPRVVGVLRPVEIGDFNVWILFPRSEADLTLP